MDRLLILTPKSALRQWQQELRHKFNIDVPILERAGSQMVLIQPDGSEEPAPDPPWDTPYCLISYHWLRRNRQAFLASDPHYDTVIVDEAHHARFQDVNDPQRRRPNQFLTLLREVSRRTRDLILLTATPMQISETELWALLNLLEPQGWNEAQFSIFYDESIELNPGHWRVLRDLYREKAHMPEQLRDRMERLIWHENEMFVGAQLDKQTMQASAALMRSNAPPKRNMSRHTRGLLKRYQDAGLITMTIPERKVEDDSITMSPEERELYDDINGLVNECYGNNPALNQTAVGFIMTVYRKRLGSSAHSYACSIQNHLDRREENEEEWELRCPGAVSCRTRIAPLRGWPEGSLLPDGFAAYARIFHPAYLNKDEERPVRWSTVASWTGRAVHPLMQFERISDLSEDPHDMYKDPPWGSHPRIGSIPERECRTLVEVLRSFTSTPGNCFFCLWEGYGNIDTRLYKASSRVRAPGRDYLLFRGPIDAIMAFITRDGPFWGHSPSIWWPEDRAWCVATDIDLFDTYVGGSEECIEAVLSNPDLEALLTTLDARLDLGGDTINAKDVSGGCG